MSSALLDQRPIIPTARQELFHRLVAQYPEVGFGGARGGAKSFAGCHEGLIQSLIYPGNMGAIVRQDLTDLRDTTQTVMRDFVLPPYRERGLKYRWFGWDNRPRLEIEVGTGPDGKPIVSIIMFRPASDIEGLMSANLGWLFADEASEIPERFYLMVSGALGRRRCANGEMAPRKLFWGSNPGPGWCHKLFPVGKVPAVQEYVRVDAKGDRHTVTRAFVPAVPKDNPHLPPEFESHLLSIYPPDWVKRFLEGDWSAFEGAVFPEFEEEKHVYTDAQAPKDMRGWVHFLCLDWGYRSPAAALLISLDFAGTFWVRREHRRAGWTPDLHAPYLRGLMEGLDSDPIMLIDYGAVDQSSGVSVLTQLNEQMGFQFRKWTKRKHGPDGNIMYCKRLLADAPPRVRVHESCRGLIEELAQAVWAENSPAMEARGEPAPEVMRDGADHSIDALFGALEWFRARPHEFAGHGAMRYGSGGTRTVNISGLTGEGSSGSVKELERRRHAEAMELAGRGPGRTRKKRGWASLLDDV